MKTTLAGLIFSFVATLNGCGSKSQSSSLASPYPPDYTYNSKCAYNEVIEVCRSENGSGIFLRLYYKGTLKNSTELNAYVKLNGRSGTFGLISMNYNGSRELLIANTGYSCIGTYGERGFTGWSCKQPTPEMSDLFFYAKNQRGTFNAWDLEVAVVDQDGNWDSNSGANYKFRIN